MDDGWRFSFFAAQNMAETEKRSYLVRIAHVVGLSDFQGDYNTPR
jgi:hypothetical protein